MSDAKFKFSDEVIGQIAKLIQVAILSGTDIVDHLRLAQCVAIDDVLYLSEEYKEQFENNIESMLQELEEHATEG